MASSQVLVCHNTITKAASQPHPELQQVAELQSLLDRRCLGLTLTEQREGKDPLWEANKVRFHWEIESEPWAASTSSQETPKAFQSSGKYRALMNRERRNSFLKYKDLNGGCLERWEKEAK